MSDVISVSGPHIAAAVGEEKSGDEEEEEGDEDDQDDDQRYGVARAESCTPAGEARCRYE